MLAKYFFKKIFKEHYSTVNKEKCINYRSQKSPCSRCADHCPQGAIAISGKGVVIEESSCRGCGICGVQCPTDGIDTMEFSEEKNIKAIQKKSRVLIGCMEEKSEGNISYPCLNGLSPEYLSLVLLLAPDKSLEFNRAPCSKCEIPKEHQIFYESLKIAEDLLCSLNLEPNTKVINAAEELPEEPEERMSRRALFEEMKNGSLNLGMDMARDTLSHGDEVFPLRELLIKNLCLLEKKSPEIMDVEITTPLFTAWQVGDTCDGCGICTSVCPSQALELTRDRKEVRLLYRSSLCTNCKLCSQVCPKVAMKWAPIKLNHLKEEILLKKMDLIPCPGCRQAKVVQRDSIKKPPLCKSCEKRENMKKSLRRVKNQ